MLNTLVTHYTRLVTVAMSVAVVTVCSYPAHAEEKGNPKSVMLGRVAPSPDVIIMLREGRAKGVITLPKDSQQLRRDTVIPDVDIPDAEPVAQPLKSERSKTVKSFKDGIWDRIRKRLVLVDDEHPHIDKRIAYLKRNPGYINLLAKRSAPFMHFILAEIERQGLPADLALLPMVESAFQPTAVSPKGAAGLWQIMPATGEQYGLQITEGYDSRYNVYNSTRAALSYLSYLKKLFKGDWLLALAAYNAGEGAVQRAMATNRKAGKETHFWNLPLPAETQAFVPQIAALSRVVFNPKENGLKLKKVSNAPYLARIKVNTDISLWDSVTASGIPLEDFRRFNPAFKPDVEIPEQSYMLMMPLEQAELLAGNLPDAELIAARKYTVKRGDTLSAIASQYGVTYKKLAQWNGISVKSVLIPGQELIIYPQTTPS